MRHPERREPCAANVVELLRVESPKTRASKSARCLRRSGIYEGLPIAFHRKCYILYHGRTLATKCNIPLARQIRFVARSLRRYAPCPHCIRSTHFNRVRLRVSPSAQDDAQGQSVVICGGFAAFSEMTHRGKVRCEHTERETPPQAATPHPPRAVPLLLQEKATDAILSVVDFLFCFLQMKAF